MSQSQLVDRILVNKPEADRVILNKAYIFGKLFKGKNFLKRLWYFSVDKFF